MLGRKTGITTDSFSSREFLKEEVVFVFVFFSSPPYRASLVRCEGPATKIDKSFSNGRGGCERGSPRENPIWYERSCPLLFPCLPFRGTERGAAAVKAEPTREPRASEGAGAGGSREREAFGAPRAHRETGLHPGREAAGPSERRGPGRGSAATRGIDRGLAGDHVRRAVTASVECCSASLPPGRRPLPLVSSSLVSAGWKSPGQSRRRSSKRQRRAAPSPSASPLHCCRSNQ